MASFEIERKFTIKKLPLNLEQFPSLSIEQAYLNTNPVIRIRKQDTTYYLTYKGSGMLSREEYNLPLNEASYYHLRKKVDGNIITKKRYQIPLEPTCLPSYLATDLTIELDIFEPPFEPLIIAEVEFPSEEIANAFLAPDWFDQDVTFDSKYHNSNMSKRQF